MLVGLEAKGIPYERQRTAIAYPRRNANWEHSMDTARLFQSGRSQAVQLPKKYRFAGSTVALKHFGNGVLLLPLDEPWQMLEAGLAAFEPGFVITREQPSVHE